MMPSIFYNLKDFVKQNNVLRQLFDGKNEMTTPNRKPYSLNRLMKTPFFIIIFFFLEILHVANE